MSDAVQEAQVQSEEESSWEVYTTDGTTDLSESGEESFDEDSGDENDASRIRKYAALPRSRSFNWSVNLPSLR